MARTRGLTSAYSSYHRQAGQRGRGRWKKWGGGEGLKEVETNRHRAGLFLVFGLNKHTEHINSKRVVQFLSLEMPPHPDACSRQSHYHRGGVGGEEGQHHHHHLCVCTTAEVAVLERVGGEGRCCRSFCTPRRGTSHHPEKYGFAHYLCLSWSYRPVFWIETCLQLTCSLKNEELIWGIW